MNHHAQPDETIADLLARDDISRFRLPLEQFIKSELGEKITTGAIR